MLPCAIDNKGGFWRSFTPCATFDFVRNEIECAHAAHRLSASFCTFSLCSIRAGRHLGARLCHNRPAHTVHERAKVNLKAAITYAELESAPDLSASR